MSTTALQHPQSSPVTVLWGCQLHWPPRPQRMGRGERGPCPRYPGCYVAVEQPSRKALPSALAFGGIWEGAPGCSAVSQDWEGPVVGVAWAQQLWETCMCGGCLHRRTRLAQATTGSLLPLGVALTSSDLRLHQGAAAGKWVPLWGSHPASPSSP